MSDDVVVTENDPRSVDVRALLEAHHRFANEHSPPEDVHALDLPGLLDPAVTFCSARCHGALLGIGALKELDPAHGELKSMHTVAGRRRHGVGRLIVVHLVGLDGPVAIAA